jgi:hypothetical protein
MQCPATGSLQAWVRNSWRPHGTHPCDVAKHQGLLLGVPVPTPCCLFVTVSSGPLHVAIVLCMARVCAASGTSAAVVAPLGLHLQALIYALLAPLHANWCTRAAAQQNQNPRGGSMQLGRQTSCALRAVG